MLSEWKYIFSRLKDTRVLENYSFMTALTVFSSLIGIIIYPYLIRVLGKEQMGLYVFLFAVVSYLQIVVDYGFDQPAAKATAEAADDKSILSSVLTRIRFAKLLNLILSVVIALPFVLNITLLRENIRLVTIIALLLFVPVLFPVWYFQGTKNMKVVTYINLFCRLMQIPLVFIFIHSPAHIVRYALIVSLTTLSGAVAAAVYIWLQGLRPVRIRLSELASDYMDATPFFLTYLAGNVKEKVLTNFIGVAFGMGEVAIYDLACKIIQVPRFFTQNINAALFPEVVARPDSGRIRLILRYEHIIGFAIVLSVSLIAYPAVLLLGGRDMIAAVPLTVILSLTIYTWLVTGAYLQFVFVPAGKYRFVAYNQLVALITCFLFFALGYMLCKSVVVVAVAITLSGFCEILFCRRLTHKFSMI